MQAKELFTEAPASTTSQWRSRHLHVRAGGRSPPPGLPEWWSGRGAAILPFNEHPHMLRHACGFALANKRHDTRALHAYLGHMNIQHAVRYTELAPTDAVHGILAWLISAVRNL